jgi:LacI family transcriptional regulator
MRAEIPPTPTSRKPPTLAEIAKIAGVSQMTASRALNGHAGVSRQKREELLLIAGELGYVPNRAAQKLSSGRSRILGVIAQLHTSFTSELVVGAGSAARAAGYELLLYSLVDADRQPPGNVLQLLQQFADGVIVLLPYEFEYLEALAAARVPVITVDQSDVAQQHPCIAGDSYQGARAAVVHLAELGHRRVGYITGNERLASARDRRRGFEHVRAQLGLHRHPELIAEGDYLQRGGYEAAQRLLRLRPRPTAIFAANDISALGALAAIREAGLRVPDDLSLVGFDDIALASQVHPALTTVRQPMQQMGRAAVNTLLAMVAGIDAPSSLITLPTELVVRSSTAPPR